MFTIKLFQCRIESKIVNLYIVLIIQKKKNSTNNAYTQCKLMSSLIQFTDNSDYPTNVSSKSGLFGTWRFSVGWYSALFGMNITQVKF